MSIKIFKIASYLLLIPWLTFSQGISNNWLFGYDSGIQGGYGGCKINFYSGFADTLSDPRPMNFSRCNANISDTLGNLLFYTNGIYIANANNDTMQNGNGLNPGPFTSNQSTYGLTLKQGNLILKLPNSDSLYYLFHETYFFDQSVNDERVKEIYYSIIDMSLNGGLGGVIQKNVVLLSDTLTIGAITSCKHANGRDWWIVFHKGRGNRYYKYLLTPNGLQGPFSQDIGYYITAYDWIWQSCFSPDGTKFCSVMARDSADVLDFNRCTGDFSYSRRLTIIDSAVARGIAFSANSNVLYISSMNYIYQFNTQVNNIDSSRFIVAQFDGFSDPFVPFYSAYFLSQLAQDNKIYINCGNSNSFLHVINNPDNLGHACNLIQHAFVLPSQNAFTLPNFPNFFLGPVVGSSCDSLSFQANQFSIQRKKTISQNWPSSSIPTTEQTENENLYSDRFKYIDFLSGKAYKDVQELIAQKNSSNENKIFKRSRSATGSGNLYGIRNHAQEFDFVRIDCSTDSLTVLNILPNYYYGSYFSSTFDNLHMKYFYTAGQKLTVLDALTGNLDTTFTFTNINPDYFIHTAYNASDNCIYGIKYNLATLQEQLSKFNPATGTFTDLFQINPTVKIGVGCKASIDPLKGEYYLQDRNLVTININSGQVTSNTPFQNPANEWLDHFAYSCKQQKFYGLTNNYHTIENYFSSIDTSSGITSRLNPNPLPTYFYKQYLSGSTIDNNTDTYYYSTANGNLYGIDINTGNIMYDHNYGEDFQLLFLESAGNYDCLTASTEDIEDISKISLYPNPGTGKFAIIGKSISFYQTKIEILDLTGKVVFHTLIDRSNPTIDLSNLASGVYIYRLNDRNDIRLGKIVLE